MSVAIYIVTDRECEDVDTFVNGKALGHAEQTAIDGVCAKAGIKSPYDYVSQDPEELQGFLEEVGGDVPDELPEEQWFKPEEGLQWTERLLNYLRENPDAINDSDAILEDLEEYQVLLLQLQKHGVRWHFAVDF